MNVSAIVALLLMAVALLPGEARTHALEPGYLSVAPLANESYRVFWRKPDVQGRPMQIDAVLPETCSPSTGPAPRSDGRAWVASWVATCEGGLAGGDITISGLEQTRTDVLVNYQTAAGQSGTQRLTPDDASFRVPVDTGPAEVLGAYVWLGIDHILSGWDHLLFVLVLMILISDRWRLVGAITGFTVAHSITLTAATLGWVALPPRPVEAIIALSIMFLASEALQRRPDAPRLSERAPWLVTFVFGLLHGFGFAGALREIGLPQHETPLALFAFNLGVELGQLAFVGAVLILAWGLARLAAVLRLTDARPAVTTVVYAVGCLSAFWFLERVLT